MPRPDQEPHARWQPVAAALAWLLPGLGHAWVGQPRRGAILACAILSVWLSGLLVGGLSAIDPPNDSDERHRSIWFVCQVMLAPSMPMVWTDRWLPHADRLLGLEPGTEVTPALGHAAEQGVLLTALAGLFNLLAIIDVSYCDPAFRRSLDARPVPQKAPQKAPQHAPQQAPNPAQGASEVLSADRAASPGSGR